jgi:hypothetical protein
VQGLELRLCEGWYFLVCDNVRAVVDGYGARTGLKTLASPRSAVVRVCFIPSSCGELLLVVVSNRTRCHFGSNARIIEVAPIIVISLLTISRIGFRKLILWTTDLSAYAMISI